MPSEYCPKCKAIKNLRASKTVQTTKDKKGKTKEIVINSYHCEECHSFIKSDEDKTRQEIFNELLEYSEKQYFFPALSPHTLHGPSWALNVIIPSP